jgi:hypothetical protein
VSIEETKHIAVNSHLLKIVEKVILGWMKTANSPVLEISFYSAGFKTGRSTQDNLEKLL